MQIRSDQKSNGSLVATILSYLSHYSVPHGLKSQVNNFAKSVPLGSAGKLTSHFIKLQSISSFHDINLIGTRQFFIDSRK